MHGSDRRDTAPDLDYRGDPHEVFYRFGGKQIGVVGNNGTNELDYQSASDSRALEGDTAFRGGASVGYASFAMGYSPVTPTSGMGAGGYTVRTGETLSSIAANLWGDSSLWYKLAEADGLSAASAPVEGQSLIVPPGVTNNSYKASNFRPYEGGEAMDIYGSGFGAEALKGGVTNALTEGAGVATNGRTSVTSPASRASSAPLPIQEMLDFEST